MTAARRETSPQRGGSDVRSNAHRLLALLLAAAGSGAAADEPLWEAGFGAGGISLPHYRGSSQSESWLLPTPYFVYRGEILRADRDGARAVFVDVAGVDADLSLALTAPARSEHDRARAGMPDLAPTLEIGPKVNIKLVRSGDWKLDLRLPVRAVFTLESNPRSIGWSATPVINLDTRWLGFDWGMHTGPLWGNRRLHGYFYDVAPAFATATRPAYSAPGGYAGWQATVAFSRRLGSFWIGGFARNDSVAGAAFEPSPLVTARDNWSYGIALAWVFAASEAMVSVPD